MISYAAYLAGAPGSLSSIEMLIANKLGTRARQRSQALNGRVRLPGCHLEQSPALALIVQKQHYFFLLKEGLTSRPLRQIGIDQRDDRLDAHAGVAPEHGNQHLLLPVIK